MTDQCAQGARTLSQEYNSLVSNLFSFGSLNKSYANKCYLLFPSAIDFSNKKENGRICWIKTCPSWVFIFNPPLSSLLWLLEISFLFLLSGVHAGRWPLVVHGSLKQVSTQIQTIKANFQWFTQPWTSTCFGIACLWTIRRSSMKTSTVIPVIISC